MVSAKGDAMVARRRPAEKAAPMKKPPVLAERRLVG
jgi:hypothetical protein